MFGEEGLDDDVKNSLLNFFCDSGAYRRNYKVVYNLDSDHFNNSGIIDSFVSMSKK